MVGIPDFIGTLELVICDMQARYFPHSIELQAHNKYLLFDGGYNRYCLATAAAALQTYFCIGKVTSAQGQGPSASAALPMPRGSKRVRCGRHLTMLIWSRAVTMFGAFRAQNAGWVLHLL